MDQLPNVHCHPNGSLNYHKTLQIHAHEMAQLLGEDALSNVAPMQAAQGLNEKYDKTYFVVEFRERGSKLFRTELKLRAGYVGMQAHQFRPDPHTYGRLVEKSNNTANDGAGNNTGDLGPLDVFLRRVRPWDIRHWINHPNREIRLAIWVAMFAFALEYSPDLVDLISALMRA